ncbi:S-methyl-5-thioribose-1-phosphate isomerase [Alphaproteobacteria bacterium]|nr:S-methyl-5-thioribose-1-phosphate isomerase [Alphaproteobacteria bacterium]
MKLGNHAYRTIWPNGFGNPVKIIDQRFLPHRFDVVALDTLADAETAIRDMWVRGAPLIGVTAVYGLYLALRAQNDDAGLTAAHERLLATRPTAVNLRWALQRAVQKIAPLAAADRALAAYQLAAEIADEDVEINRMIGVHGRGVIEAIAANKPAGEAVNILTHCNAGWLATVDWGTATSPIYQAHDGGTSLHVWVDETRPRNQGASITAFELANHGVPHTVIVDNAGGHLMQHGQVDMVITGTDRTTANGDVCNKIGTYLKALAAFDNAVPFYVALPSPTIDWSLTDGVAQIPIEERSIREVSHIWGRLDDGRHAEVKIIPDESAAANPAFDVTPARLITGGLITERGIAAASGAGLQKLFPAKQRNGA